LSRSVAFEKSWSNDWRSRQRPKLLPELRAHKSYVMSVRIMSAG
jgi:hypothetical protein